MCKLFALRAEMKAHGTAVTRPFEVLPSHTRQSVLLDQWSSVDIFTFSDLSLRTPELVVMM